MKGILVVVDMQRGFMKNDDMKKVAEDIGWLASNKDCFNGVIATVFHNTPEGPLYKIRGWREMMNGDDLKLVEDVAPFVTTVVEKARYTPTWLDMVTGLLKANGGDMPESVYVCGVNTETSVLATALQLFEHGIKPIVLPRYCGSVAGEAGKEYGLYCIRRLIGR